MTLLDTADIYGGEPGRARSCSGEALKGRRDEFVLATKFGMDMQGANGADHGVRGSRRYVRRAVEASLRRLQTDHIDLYQLHAPDPVTPIEETLGALTELVREGKVRYIGCSNFAGWQVADAAWTARPSGLEPFVSVQNRYSLLDRTVEDEVVPACERFGLGVLPFFPLEYGLLTGKYPAAQDAPEGSRAALDPEPRGWLAEADWDRIEARRGVRRDARPLDPRRGDRRPRRPAGRRLGHLRRHPRRAGRAPTPPRCAGSRPTRTSQRRDRPDASLGYEPGDVHRATVEPRGRRPRGGRTASASGDLGALAGAAVLDLDVAVGEAAADRDDGGYADQLGVLELHAGADLRGGRRRAPRGRPRSASSASASAASKTAASLPVATRCTSAGATSRGQTRPSSSWLPSAITGTARETPMP